MKRIFRVVKDKNYSTIHNGFLNCKSLSWGAKGLFAYILSKPDHWNISLNELCTHSTNGISSTRGFYKELVEAGYILKNTARDSGKFVTHYQIYEKPELNPSFGEKEITLFPNEERMSISNLEPELYIPKSKSKGGKPTTVHHASKTAHGEPTTEDLTLVITDLKSAKKVNTEKTNTHNQNLENQKELIDRILDLPSFISESEKIFQRYYDLHLDGQKFFNTDIFILQTLHSITGGNIEVIQEKILDGWKNDTFFGVDAQNIPPTPKLLDKHFNRFIKKPTSKQKKSENQIIHEAIETSFQGKFIPANNISNYRNGKDQVGGYPVRWLKEAWGLSESLIRNQDFMKDWIAEYEADFANKKNQSDQREGAIA